MGRRVFSDNEAVSETLGYILIFMIVLTCIAFILLTGNTVLGNAKSQNNFKSMEQGFTVLSSDMKQVALEGTPVKTTRIHMEGGSISANKISNGITVAFGTYTYGPVNTGNITFQSDTDQKAVSIENGGVWEEQDTSGTDINVLNPRIYVTTDPSTNARTLVLNVIRLDTSGPLAIGGSATLDITLHDNGTNIPPIPPAPNSPTGINAMITFNTNYPNAWIRFFQDSGATLVSQTSSSCTVKFPLISRVIISEHVVGVTMD